MKIENVRRRRNFTWIVVVAGENLIKKNKSFKGEITKFVIFFQYKKISPNYIGTENDKFNLKVFKFLF